MYLFYITNNQKPFILLFETKIFSLQRSRDWSLLIKIVKKQGVIASYDINS